MIVPMRSHRAFCLVLFFCLSAFVGRASAAPAVPPTVDREAAERSFLAAYDLFLQNRLWSCLDRLSVAQRQNTYYIDTYYLKALAMRRLGRYPDAMEAMRAYLEVRRADHRAQIIIRAMQDEWRILRETLYPGRTLSAFVFHANSLNSLFDVPLTHPLSFSGMTGLGKISAFGDCIFTPDTLGNNLWVFDKTLTSKTMQMPVGAPVVVLPLSPEDALLLQKSGDVMSLRINRTAGTLSPRSRGRVDANVADAATVSSTLLAVADRTGQAVKFYNLPSLGAVAEWTPKEGEKSRKLFEPVAVAAYGPLLAVADRGNGVVYVLDSYTLVLRDRFETPLPRDLEWGNQGELYILSENGEMHARYPATVQTPGVSRVVSEMKDAWSVAWTKEGPVVADVSGRHWWNSRMFPGSSASIGMIALRDPWIEGKKGEETLFLRGRVSSVFREFVLNTPPSSEAVWRDEVRPSQVSEIAAAGKGATLFYSPTEESKGEERRVRRAFTFGDVWSDLAAASRAGQEMPRIIVLDTRVEVPEGQALLFFSFLQHQGIRLDLWALSRPASTVLTYISRSTLGNTYYSNALEAVPRNDDVEWLVGVPLPPETVPFGYPADATLSIFATVDMIRFNDWIPVWPSLVKRKK